MGTPMTIADLASGIIDLGLLSGGTLELTTGSASHMSADAMPMTGMFSPVTISFSLSYSDAITGICTRSDKRRRCHHSASAGNGIKYDENIISNMDGTPSEIFEQGVRYELGHGVEKDEQKAFQLYLQAADGGNIPAECAVADMYMSGRGTVMDPAKGLEYFSRAAEKGSGRAMLNIGMMHLIGAGVPMDSKAAAEWFLRAADAGEAGAFAELGMLYINGEGVEQDIEEGAKWMLRSAESGDPVSQYKVGYMYEEGEGLEKDLGKAYMWYARSADQDIPDAQFKAASMLYDGIAVERDEIKALNYYTKSAKAGFVPSMFNIGVIMFTKGDYDEAFRWFQNGSMRNDADCQFYFGRLYIEGKGVKRDLSTGIKWLRLSAKNGNTMAQDVINRVESSL